MGKLNVLDELGDTEHSWDSPEEAAVVEGVFNGLLARGYMCARMGSGGVGERITSFDASAGSLLMMPPLRGG